MKLKKLLGLLLVIVLLAGMMMGCAGSKPEDQKNEQTAPPQSEEAVRPDSIEDTAVYTGRIDNNSVEMELKGNPQAFQLTEELMESWDSLGFAEGDELKIQYQERENDRPILLDAQKI